MKEVPTLEALLFHIITFALLIQLGGIVVYGTWKRWRVFVDPPMQYWPVISQSFIKRFLGKKGLLFYLYAVGSTLILSGAVGLSHRLFLLAKGLGYLK